MADKITTTKTLGIGVEYISGKTNAEATKYIKVPNPRTGITETQIKTAMQNYLTGDIFLDEYTLDPLAGASVKTSYIETVTKTDYDIGFFD